MMTCGSCGFIADWGESVAALVACPLPVVSGEGGQSVAAFVACPLFEIPSPDVG